MSRLASDTYRHSHLLRALRRAALLLVLAMIVLGTLGHRLERHLVAGAFSAIDLDLQRTRAELLLSVADRALKAERSDTPGSPGQPAMAALRQRAEAFLASHPVVHQLAIFDADDATRLDLGGLGECAHPDAVGGVRLQVDEAKTIRASRSLDPQAGLPQWMCLAFDPVDIQSAGARGAMLADALLLACALIGALVVTIYLRRLGQSVLGQLHDLEQAVAQGRWHDLEASPAGPDRRGASALARLMAACARRRNAHRDQVQWKADCIRRELPASAPRADAIVAAIESGNDDGDDRGDGHGDE